MRATPIEMNDLPPRHRRAVIAPPEGDLTDADIAPVEMAVGEDPVLGLVYRARMVLEPGELERLAAGEPLWLTLAGSVPPFSLSMFERA